MLINTSHANKYKDDLLSVCDVNRNSVDCSQICSEILFAKLPILVYFASSHDTFCALIANVTLLINFIKPNCL